MAIIGGICPDYNLKKIIIVDPRFCRFGKVEYKIGIIFKYA